MRGFADSMFLNRSLHLSLAGILLAFGLWGCAGSSSEAKKSASSAPGVSGPSRRDTGPTLAIVGGRRFTMRDVDSVLASAPPSIREEYSDPEQFKSLVERLAQQWALFLEARRVGTEADPNYRVELAGSQRQLLMKYYYKNLVRNLPAISDSAVHSYYDEHANDFKAPGRARVRHIQVPTQARAREVMKRLRAGSTWDQICAKYSTDKGNSKTGGVLGYVTTDSDLVPVLGRAPSIVAAAFKIKEGETSEPLKSDRAWHLIRVDEQTLVGEHPFKDVEPRIRSLLEGQRNQHFDETLQDSLKVRYGLVLFPDSIKIAHNPPQTPADLFAKAQAEVSPRDRIELFEGIVSRFPNDKSAVQAAFMIGFTYSEELKDYPAARKAFEKFIREHPDSDLVSSAKWMLANMGTGATPPGLGPMGEGPTLEIVPPPDSLKSKP